MGEERRVAFFFPLVYKGSQPSVPARQWPQHCFCFPHIVICFAPKIQVGFLSLGEQRKGAAGETRGSGSDREFEEGQRSLSRVGGLRRKKNERLKTSEISAKSLLSLCKILPSQSTGNWGRTRKLDPTLVPHQEDEEAESSGPGMTWAPGGWSRRPPCHGKSGHSVTVWHCCAFSHPRNP